MLTNDGFKKALAIILSVHPQLDPKESKEFVYKAWYRMFQDISDKALLDAASRFVMEYPKLFPGDNFVAIIRQIVKPMLSETEGDCIELTLESVSKFGYMREPEAMSWLQNRSPLIAACVRRIGYQEICRSENSDVLRGQIRAIFKSERERAIQAGGIIASAEQLESGSLPRKLIPLAERVGKLLEKD